MYGTFGIKLDKSTLDNIIHHHYDYFYENALTKEIDPVSISDFLELISCELGNEAILKSYKKIRNYYGPKYKFSGCYFEAENGVEECILMHRNGDDILTFRIEYMINLCASIKVTQSPEENFEKPVDILYASFSSTDDIIIHDFANSRINDDLDLLNYAAMKQFYLAEMLDLDIEEMSAKPSGYKIN